MVEDEAAEAEVEVVAGGGGFKFVGGTKTTEQLIAETKRGILVTHFFYIRFLDQRTVLLTGLTRDGTFLIEKGKITHAGEELPLERESAVHARARSKRSDARSVSGGEGDAVAACARFQLLVVVRRGVTLRGDVERQLV